MSREIHWHDCPVCFDSFQCSDRCTIEPDLSDDGRDFGSHTVCHRIECQLRAAADRYNERLEARQREALHRLREASVHLQVFKYPRATVLCGSMSDLLTRTEAHVTCPECRDLMEKPR